MLLDLGPLAAFMIADQVTDIFVATGVLMIAVVIAFIASWIMARRIALIPLVTLGFILIFGALTLLFDDETFIKVEVTFRQRLGRAVRGHSEQRSASQAAHRGAVPPDARHEVRQLSALQPTRGRSELGVGRRCPRGQGSWPG